MSRIKEIDARVEAIPRERWVSSLEVDENGDYPYPVVLKEDGGQICYGLAEEEFATADFIAHARQDIPCLVEVVKRQEKLLKAIYEAPMDHRKWIVDLVNLLAELEGK